MQKEDTGFVISVMQRFLWLNSLFLRDFPSSYSASRCPQQRLPGETADIKLNFSPWWLKYAVKGGSVYKEKPAPDSSAVMGAVGNGIITARQTVITGVCLQCGGKYVDVHHALISSWLSSTRHVCRFKCEHGGCDARNGAHLIIIDPEISLLGPQVPLYNCPTFKTYEQLRTDTTKSQRHFKSETFREKTMSWQQQQYQCHLHNYSPCCCLQDPFCLCRPEKSSCSSFRSLHLRFYHLWKPTRAVLIYRAIYIHTLSAHTQTNDAFSNRSREIRDWWW